MAASDHLSPQQFDPTNYGGWHNSDYGFGTATRKGQVYPADPMNANALGGVESRDEINQDPLTDRRVGRYGGEGEVRLFLPHTAHRWRN